MKPRHRSDLIAGYLQGASALPLRGGFSGTGLEHIASHEETEGRGFPELLTARHDFGIDFFAPP
jgi:hypothetical protein